MADLLIRPGRLKGTVMPPPSKSDAHRALVAASLAGDVDLISGLPDPESDDIKATRQCLSALIARQHLLDCGESGTTLRLLIPVAAAKGIAEREPVVFKGSGRLPQRPLAEFKTIFEGHGVSLVFPPHASLPLTLQGRLTAGIYEVPGHVSSQYLSGLLFALPLLAGDSSIRLTTPLESAPYVDMTLRTLKAFGIHVKKQSGGYFIPGGQKYRTTIYHIEKDYSQAAFWLTAAYGDCPLLVNGLATDSAQGDKAMLTLLEAFKQRRARYSIDASQIPDLVPILAVAAALTPSETHIIKAGRLRLKESDRLAATEQALSAIGADIRQSGDSLIIQGGKPLTGGTVDSWGDHRIAMAVAIAALFTRDGVQLSRAEAVNKSYPDFFKEFRRLGGEVDELNLGTTS